MDQTKEKIQELREIRIHKILNVKDNGRRITLRCPFHSERTGSFSLYSDNSYHCFGCGAHGNGAVDFCIGLGFSFKETLEELSKYN